jgi:hypothetical protein
MPRSKNAAQIPVPGNIPAFFAALIKERRKKNPDLTQAQLGEELQFNETHFSKMFAGKIAAGPTSVARATVFLSAEEACKLLEAYLSDEIEQIEFERTRLGREYRKGVQPLLKAGSKVCFSR